MPGAELGLGLTIAPTVYSGPLSPPVQLLRQSAPGEIIVSSKVGRLVDGWVVLEARLLRLRTDDHAHTGGYAVIGVSPGRKAWLNP